LAVLARNCRTSIDMLQRFYGHTEPEMGAKKMFQAGRPPAPGQPVILEALVKETLKNPRQ
jgi:hypothetical protein